MIYYCFSGSLDGKESACNADLGLIPGLGRSPEEGNGNPLQYSCQRIPWTEETGRLQSMGKMYADGYKSQYLGRGGQWNMQS